MKKLSIIFLLMITSAIACKTRRKVPKAPKPEVPIAINIKSENNASINLINLDYYRFQVLDELDNFQAVNFVLVEKDENPEVTLDLTIENFTLWPREERISRRRVSRNIIVGKDANGKAVYQTVTATVDIVQIQRRSNARFTSILTVKGDPPLKFKRTFVPNYNYVNNYIDNIQGDPRAIDASLNMSRGMGFEPMENDFLLMLSKQEMLRRLSSELRKYYDTKTKAAIIK